MATIRLENLRHSYATNPASDADWALKRIDLTWDDGGAYALLGPSGCGKTTLLNLISGLLRPTEGRIRFGERDVTDAPPDARNIAQVFQFPVVYDTMTVYDNLAFPLRNRGMPEREIAPRVAALAEMLDLGAMLGRRASGLTADGKQKISLGRGLVRPDVNVVMFDEPLTVIDPHLKWTLRSKLKELHQRVRSTMIYVTHDQTEAMTFADRVVVMHDGTVVQSGTPVELFERPHHTFVGHFIGSPGMNVLPCTLDGDVAVVFGERLALARTTVAAGGASTEVGVRPEFVRLADRGMAARVVRISDAGRHRIVETVVGRVDGGGAGDSARVRLLIDEALPVPAGEVRLAFDPAHTHLYVDSWLAGA
ncbi:MAG: ABC transporter ATP-binding protein [Lautropia sp.]